MAIFVLASASERRSRILSDCGIEHIVDPSGVDEIMSPDMAPGDIVIKNARDKAVSISRKYDKGVILGADTIVIHDGMIIGKPSDEDEARRFLARFSNSDIEVITGLYLINLSNGKEISGYDKSFIKAASIDAGEADRLFELMASYDKAGGFSIEGPGALIFDDIRGSYFNILGLPLMKLKKLASGIGIDILEYIRKNQ